MCVCVQHMWAWREYIDEFLNIWMYVIMCMWNVYMGCVVTITRVASITVSGAILVLSNLTYVRFVCVVRVRVSCCCFYTAVVLLAGEVNDRPSRSHMLWYNRGTYTHTHMCVSARTLCSNSIHYINAHFLRYILICLA